MACREICSTQVGRRTALADTANTFSLPMLYNAIELFQPYSTYFLTLIRTILIFNTIVALRPLVQRKDDLLDIHLTPAQRRLLGLSPHTWISICHTAPISTFYYIQKWISKQCILNLAAFWKRQSYSGNPERVAFFAKCKSLVE